MLFQGPPFESFCRYSTVRPHCSWKRWRENSDREKTLRTLIGVGLLDSDR